MITNAQESKGPYTCITIDLGFHPTLLITVRIVGCPC